MSDLRADSKVDRFHKMMIIHGNASEELHWQFDGEQVNEASLLA